MLIELIKEYSNNGNIVMYACQAFYNKQQNEWFRLNDDQKTQIHQHLFSLFEGIMTDKFTLAFQPLNYLCLSSALFVYSKPETVQPYLTQIFGWLNTAGISIPKIELCLLLIKVLI